MLKIFFKFIYYNVCLSWLSLISFSYLQAYLLCEGDEPKHDYICSDSILHPPGSFIFDDIGIDQRILILLILIWLNGNVFYYVYTFLYDMHQKQKHLHIERKVVLSCTKTHKY